MEVALFEDDAWQNFIPIAATRHVAQQLLGSSAVYEQIARRAGKEGVSFLGRAYLEGVVRQETGLPYNDAAGTVLLLNARVNPLSSLKKWAAMSPGSALTDRGEVAAVVARPRDLERVATPDGVIPQARLKLLAKGMERIDADRPLLLSYPWEALELNPAAISAAGRSARKPLIVSPRAEVEEFVSFDVRAGPVIIDDGARIEAFSRISGPCYIGKEAVVQSALIREGTTVSEGCKVGGEVAHSVLYRKTNKAHEGYLGHSVVGSWVNIGAGAVASDLKNTYGSVRVSRGGKRVDTGLVKLGTLIGDAARVSIGSMIYSGRTIGVAARCSGVVDRDVPDFAEYNGSGKELTKLELQPVLLSHQRMKRRREQAVSPAEKILFTRLHAAAQKGV